MKKIGEDNSYSGLTNRDFCKEMGIQTAFVKRGKPSKEILYIVFGILAANAVKLASRLIEHKLAAAS